MIDESLPKFIVDHQQAQTQVDLGPKPYIRRFDKWAERLWPCMAWTIFFFNLSMALHFGWEIWFQDHYNYTQHITTAVTMCASYIALIWAHNNLLRKDHGLE